MMPQCHHSEHGLNQSEIEAKLGSSIIKELNQIQGKSEK